MRFFNRVTLQTPESVELEFSLAGIGSRAFALLIDYHILGLTLVIFLVVWSILSNQLLNYLEQLDVDYSIAPSWLLAIALIVCFVIFVGYFVFFETVWQGQSPGKRLAKIRVIRDDGRPVRIGQATMRALLRPIDDLLSLGVFMIVLSKREKRLGDWVAGTIVVQDVRPTAKSAFALSDQAEAIAQQLLAMADFSNMLPDDFAVIREYLQRRSLMERKAKSDLSLTLARQVKAVIALETLPQDMTPDAFLEAAYLAYQQQRSEP
ncbi:MAG TPA: RDD family protein [Chroococcidiopsis sp.]